MEKIQEKLERYLANRLNTAIENNQSLKEDDFDYFIKKIVNLYEVEFLKEIMKDLQRENILPLD